MRLLAIDAGNTRIKWGLHNGQSWLQRGVVASGEIAGLPALLTVAPDHLISSDVAGAAIDTALARLFPSLPHHTVRSTHTQCGLTNSYDKAEQLGSDRWAALIAVHKLSRDIVDARLPSPEGPALVVTAGTALTADTLHKGVFLGGVILPGYRLMHDALAAGTQMNGKPGQFNLFPRNTADAISSGSLLGLVGAIEHLHSALQRQTGQLPAIWLNGGDAALLAPHLPNARTAEENLVLTGLYYIALEVFA